MQSPVPANATSGGDCPSAPAPNLAEALDQIGYVQHLLTALATSAYALQPEALGVIAHALEDSLEAARVAANTSATMDAPLLALLASADAAEAAHSAACAAGDDEAGDDASDRLRVALAGMAETRAQGWHGIAAKAVRICRSLGDGTQIDAADAPVARSLAADLARLAPEVTA